MSRRDVYFGILALMDKALVRGASHFTTENADALQGERARWLEMGGSDAEIAIIDQFLGTTRTARGVSDDHARSYTDRAMELKRAWRNVGAPD